MIWESSHWKEPLLKTATWLRRIRISESTQERTYVRIEKELFLGFYSVRKLLETYKVSDKTKKQQFEISWYPNIEKVNYLNWHDIHELYDFSVEKLESRNIKFICNLFIHSFVFIPYVDDRLDGVYISSDRTKNKKIYYISMDTILKIFRLVGHDYPSSASFKLCEETGDYVGHAE